MAENASDPTTRTKANSQRLAALEEVAYAANRVIQSQDSLARNKDDAARKVAADYLRRLKEKIVALNQVTGAGSLFDTAAETRDA
jgi:ElaB/YqjD/DUF883 family membrane-anchored ribosome-binding protein